MVSPKLIEYLERARGFFGLPIHILSGFRCLVHNRAVGGTEDSAHMKGEAADIRISGSFQRRRLGRALDLAGFPRIGFYQTFLHGDVSTTLPEGWWVK